MLGYTMYGTNDLEAAKAFYDKVLGAVGIGRLMEFPNGAVAYGVAWDKPMFAIGTPENGEPASVGNGAMMALAMDDRAKVDVVHAAACEAGGKCGGPPGVRGEEGPQAFYGAYFRDLDGNKFCAYRIGPA
ncbi:glyoxalase [alpha proteobacterium AAP81b]|nr:glyoxalase [alpha proteobacterium AAP81b]